jgi:hypothetical protein
MALVTTPALLLTFLAALLGACAGPTGHVQPPPADPATGLLPCVGRSRRAREADPKLGEIDIRTRPVSSDALEASHGSCPCPRAGDLRGEHCWDHPCDPAPLPASAPTSEGPDQASPSHEDAGPFVSRCTTVLH